jgi:hypothetical protein
MSVFIEGMGVMKAVVNGQLVNESNVKGHYDGSNLEFTTVVNRPLKHIYETKSYKLNNDDIMKLLSKPAHQMSLEERIMNDYSVTRKSIRKSKAKTKTNKRKIIKAKTKKSIRK